MDFVSKHRKSRQDDKHCKFVMWSNAEFVSAQHAGSDGYPLPGVGRAEHFPEDKRVRKLTDPKI